MIFLLSLAGFRRWPGSPGNSSCSAPSSGGDDLGPLWLVILAIVMSMVSFYYYLRVLKAAYVEDAADGAPPIRVPWPTRLALILLAALVILLGCAPGWLTRFL